MGLYNRTKERVCTKKREDVFSIKGEKRESTSICRKSTVKRVYLIVKVTIDFASTLCSKEK